MRPIFEDGLVHRLRLVQMLTDIIRNAGPKDVVVAAFYDIDCIDLNVTQMVHRTGHSFGSAAEWRILIESLRPKPDASGFGFCQLQRRANVQANE